MAALAAGNARAADSSGCEGGGFQVPNLASPATGNVVAGALGTNLHVQGKYLQFDVDGASPGVRNVVLTGAPDARDLTGGVPTPVLESKLPGNLVPFYFANRNFRNREGDPVPHKAVRRGRDRGRAAGHGLHAPVQGPGPGARTRHQPRLPVLRQRRRSPAAAFSDALRSTRAARRMAR